MIPGDRKDPDPQHSSGQCKNRVTNSLFLPCLKWSVRGLVKIVIIGYQLWSICPRDGPRGVKNCPRDNSRVAELVELIHGFSTAYTESTTKCDKRTGPRSLLFITSKSMKI